MREPAKVLFGSILVGICVPLVVVAYEYAVYNTFRGISSVLGKEFWIAPRIGALIVIMMNIPQEKVSTEALIRYLYRGRYLERRYSILILIGSIATIGFGLSAGTAGPIVLIGASIGLLIADVVNIRGLRKNAMILIGSATALSAHISAPIASTLFVFEVIAAGVLVERDAIFVALSTAESVTIATLIRERLGFISAYGEIHASPPPVSLHTLTIVAIGSVLSGIFSAFLVSLFEGVYILSNKIRARPKLFLASAVMSLSYFVFPVLLSPRIPYLSGTDALVYAILKPAVTAITITFGGIGGTFMPTIASAIAFGSFLNRLFSVDYLEPLALAAIFGASSRCPLASIVLALEMFGMDPALSPRLVMSTTIAMIVHTFIVDGLSLYTLSMYAKHERIRSFYVDPFACTRVYDVMRKVEPISRDEHVAKALYKMHEESIHALPIVDDEGKLVGIVTLGDFKRAFLMGIEVKPDDPVRKISPKRKPITIEPDKTLVDALELMDKHNVDHLIVVKGDKILGIVTRDDLLRFARKNIVSDEILRTPHRPPRRSIFYSSVRARI